MRPDLRSHHWGISKARAKAIVADHLDRVLEAIAAARDETVGVPSELVAMVESSLTRFRCATA
jgi:hypothetical protein